MQDDDNDLTMKVVSALVEKVRVPLQDLRTGRVMLLEGSLLCPERLQEAVQPAMEALGVPLVLYDDSTASSVEESETESAFDAVASVLFGTPGLEDVPFAVTPSSVVVIVSSDEQHGLLREALRGPLGGGPYDGLLLVEVRGTALQSCQTLSSLFAEEDGGGIDVEELSRLLHSTGSVDEFLRSLS